MLFGDITKCNVVAAAMLGMFNAEMCQACPVSQGKLALCHRANLPCVTGHMLQVVPPCPVSQGTCCKWFESPLTVASSSLCSVHAGPGALIVLVAPVCCCCMAWVSLLFWLKQFNVPTGEVQTAAEL